MDSQKEQLILRLNNGQSGVLDVDITDDWMLEALLRVAVREALGCTEQQVRFTITGLKVDLQGVGPADPLRATRQLERQFGGKPLPGCLDHHKD